MSTESVQSATITANTSALTAIQQTTQATATVTFSNGTTQDATASCTNWRSDNETALTVNNAGLLTAHGSGSATITATCQGASARVTLVVTLKSTTLTLSGIITDGYSTGILPGIAVQIVDGPNTGKSATTDATGSYSLGDLSAGTFTVAISAIRYLTATRSVTLARDTRLNVVLQRNDAFPANGTYNYTLTVHSPGLCLTQSVGRGGCGPPPPDWVSSDFIVNGQLVVLDDGMTLRFVPLSNTGATFFPVGSNPLFAFQRSGTRLDGAILFSSDISMATAGHTSLVSMYMESRAFSGQTDNNGRFAGRFDGSMGIWHFGFPCDREWICATSGFTWTLTPR